MYSQDDDAVRQDDTFLEDEEAADEIPEPRRVTYRGSGSDPTFGFLVAIALSVGLTPLIPESSDLRFAVVWTVLGIFGVLAWLLGDMERIDKEVLENIVWGVVFALIVGAPMLLVGGDTLATTVHLIFRTEIGGEIQSLPIGAVLAMVIFAMPTAETLFFRGLMQTGRPFWLVGVLSSVWSILLFLPMIEVRQFPAVALIIATALTMMNLIYAYVRRRNGLAAAWLCQITVNFVLLFIPYVSR
ncbi:MAG TPA: CPBP family glutamic-type intramembrane protease [Oceanobacillus sp.]|nr:CPBP family glutamic-type intramembrane protease [Oceanobacillus sp.]